MGKVKPAQDGAFPARRFSAAAPSPALRYRSLTCQPVRPGWPPGMPESRPFAWAPIEI